MNYNRQLTIRRQNACVQNILCPTFTVTGNINSITFKRAEASTEVLIQTWGLDSEGNAVRGELLGFPIGLYENVARANAPIMYGEILNECNYTVPAIILSGRFDQELIFLRGTDVQVEKRQEVITFEFSSYSFLENDSRVPSENRINFLQLFYGENPKGKWRISLFPNRVNQENYEQVFTQNVGLNRDLKGVRGNSVRLKFDLFRLSGIIRPNREIYEIFELSKVN